MLHLQAQNKLVCGEFILFKRGTFTLGKTFKKNIYIKSNYCASNFYVFSPFRRCLCV